ncbi:hypothetical protein [Sphaerisporangium fuscum]|uniref:hypothetical protein n=1 Tax=Sphaerisporangium fuscum TaxID=2835868 RepID=UPI001BDD8E2C|nr:hypothetical protein [Sphaerisporangium fuscum]
MTEESKMSDPRDEPAPLLPSVGMLAGSAALIMLMTWLFGEPEGSSVKWLLFGPVLLLFYEVAVNEVWWRRWWGAIPGAVIGLVVHFEGRPTLSDLIGPTWAGPVAYVLAWAAFGLVFALASRVPVGTRTGTGDG